MKMNLSFVSGVIIGVGFSLLGLGIRDAWITPDNVVTSPIISEPKPDVKELSACIKNAPGYEAPSGTLYYWGTDPDATCFPIVEIVEELAKRANLRAIPAQDAKKARFQ